MSKFKNFYQGVFSIKNNDKTHRIITILGIKMSFKKSLTKNEIDKKNKVNFHKEDNKFLSLKVKGQGNNIVIGKLAACNMGTLCINLFGDNCTIIIEDGFHIGINCSIRIGHDHPNFGKSEDVSIKIAQNTSMETVSICTVNSHAKINIGRNCMFSSDIVLYHTDSHPIFDLDTGKIINKVKTLNIGNHCWIGAKSTILKNTLIADDIIVGYGAVVSGKFYDKHCAIAGNPAKIVKTNITWDSNGSTGYVQNE